MARIDLDRLAHSYDSPGTQLTYALRPFTHTWEDGETYALLGPSGCGKTTLLNIMSGIVRPSEGRVCFNGLDVTELPTARRNIAQVFQFPVIYRTMTVFENLAFPLHCRQLPQREIRERVGEVAELLNLTRHLQRAALRLSADAKQLISLGRGLVRNDVAAILLDEPLTVIDPQLKFELRRKLKEVNRRYRLTLIYVTHDQTEAMTTVDVNTGGFVGLRNFDDTIFKTNLEAAQTIARQLRLRNLGGIIIVDFIDMETVEHRAAVLAEFNKALARDHTRVTVNGFTALGLVEMTRKRTRESLAHVLCEPCSTCSGRGEVKTAQTVAYEILRELLREARQFDAREFRILAAPAVTDLFLDEESQSLAMLSDFIGKTVSLQAETGYAQEQFDIVLL